MIGMLQRVTRAEVAIGGKTVASIGPGLLVLIGVERDDTVADADRLLDRLLGYRVFADAEGRMNRSLVDTGGGLLLVPQFTLAADTQKGMRPSFTPAASPEMGQRLFEYLAERARARHEKVGTGVFGADMQVGLTNDGPVTFWLGTRGKRSGPP
jgi:D-tyrosyl-tRNA(Tyr) deacylase